MTGPLFRIDLPSIYSLTWSRASGSERHASLWQPPGRLRVRDPDAVVERFPPSFFEIDVRSAISLGPRLTEETTYQVYLTPLNSSVVELRHDDPVLLRGLTTEPDGTVHGTINFGSAAGHSRFTIAIDGRPRTTFEVEVFPTKLDYASDYVQMVAEVQDIATGLALEYLRSTFQFGTAIRRQQPVTNLEWILLLRSLFGELERALRHIEQRPRRAISRPHELRSAERIRRPDSTLRSAVRRQAGRGPLLTIDTDLAVRQNVWSRQAQPTLDTAEHRWLAHQLRMIRRSLARLTSILEGSKVDEESRLQRQLADLRLLERRASRLEAIEPLAAATSPPSPGFSSQQLQTAPGYREAYQLCLVLRAGLRLDGDAVSLSTKDLHRLYEYWCYLTLVRLIASHVPSAPRLDELFKIRQAGLRIHLQPGTNTEVRFDLPKQRLRVRYNPSFTSSAVMLVPQRPDIVVSVEADGWPDLHLILDAKYRRDDSVEYRNRYGASGPPEDALNLLHRYRDAILQVEATTQQPQHVIVEAAAIFPSTDGKDFRASRHWKALQHIGVGAIPAVPSNIEHLDTWVSSALKASGWRLASRSIPHAGQVRYREYVEAANTPALLHVLARDEIERVVTTGEFAVRYVEDDELTVPLLGLIRAWTTKDASTTLSLLRIDHIRVNAQDATGDTVKADPHALTVAYKVSPVSTWTLRLNSPQVTPPHRTNLLAIMRSNELADLHLHRLAEWQLVDQVRSDPAMNVDLRFRDDEEHVWLTTAAETRARYDHGEWVVEQPGQSQKRVDLPTAVELLSCERFTQDPP